MEVKLFEITSLIYLIFFNSNVLDNKDINLLNKESAAHYSSIMVDVAETVARAVTRIVLIEDRNTSLKVNKQYVYMMSH